VLGADGRPMYAGSGNGSPRVPPGGSIGAGGVILDANGHPVLGADGQPVKLTDPRVPPGGSIGAGGIILDASGKPVLGADGRPITISTDPRVPPGGSIGEGGVILDAKGNPVLGEDGQPLIADVERSEVHLQSASALGSGQDKFARHGVVVPAGRMLTLSRIRARDVPNVDRRSLKANDLSDPYIIFSLLGEGGEQLDEVRTNHQNDQRNPDWLDVSLRLFVPNDKAAGPDEPTAPAQLRITLMDFNRRKKDVCIGVGEVSISVGNSKLKVEIESHVGCGALRPYIIFRCEATPQLFYEQVEWKRVVEEDDELMDSDDDEPAGSH